LPIIATAMLHPQETVYTDSSYCERQDPTHSVLSTSYLAERKIIPHPNTIFILCSLSGVIHNFLIGPLLLRIVAPCSMHAWGEQSSTKKHNRTYHPAFQVEEGAFAS
jgi:hypothetical protein